LCRVILVVVILESDFFEKKFHVHLSSPAGQIDHNDKELHTIVYLQVAIISQALIFVTRSHGFFFMERPSFALMGAFILAQLISSLIAGFADFGFTNIHKISGSWIGIIWVWVIPSFYLFIPCVLMCRDRISSGLFPST
jgi:H+-transporting ATPase